MKKIFTIGLSLFFVSQHFESSGQGFVNILPDKDNTLYESATGNLSNGAGPHIFAGVDDNGNIKRAVLKFDIASNIPIGFTITDVTLTVTMDKTIAGATNVTLHTLNMDWGEAGSVAPGQGGTGGAAQTGDATWIHNFFDTSTWTTPGGDFNTAPSATTSIAGNGTYSWNSPQMIADVQAWLNNPSSNFGWIIIGDETTQPTAKRFYSKEFPSATGQPVLTVLFVGPCTSPDIPTINASGPIFCAGEPVNLSISGNLNDATDWFLYSDSCGGTPLASNATGNFTVTPTSTTTYYVRGEGGCVTPGSCGNIGITPFTVDTSVTQSMATLTAVSSAAQYQWVDCNNNYTAITGQTNQSFTPTINGNYAVIVQENGCIDTSGCRNVIVVGIEENNPSIEFNVFPNPFKEELTIKLSELNVNGLRIEIVNSQGKVMQRSDLVTQKKIKTSELSPGIYLIRIYKKSSNTIVGEKTIVKR